MPHVHTKCEHHILILTPQYSLNAQESVIICPLPSWNIKTPNHEIENHFKIFMTFNLKHYQLCITSKYHNIITSHYKVAKNHNEKLTTKKLTNFTTSSCYCNEITSSRYELCLRQLEMIMPWLVRPFEIWNWMLVTWRRLHQCFHQPIHLD